MARWLDNFEPMGFPVADSNLPITIVRILASGAPANARTASSGGGDGHIVAFCPDFLVAVSNGRPGDRASTCLSCPVLVSKDVQPGFVGGQRSGQWEMAAVVLGRGFAERVQRAVDAADDFGMGIKLSRSRCMARSWLVLPWPWCPLSSELWERPEDMCRKRPLAAGTYPGRRVRFRDARPVPFSSDNLSMAI